MLRLASGLIGLLILAGAPPSAMAQDGCPFATDQLVDAEWNSTTGLWQPAIVVGIVGDGPYCGVTVRYLAAPPDAYFDPQRTWTVSVSHVRDATLARPGNEAEQLAIYADPSYGQCGSGPTSASYTGDDDISVIRNAVALRWEKEFGPSLHYADIGDVRLGTAFVNGEGGNYNLAAPGGAIIVPAELTETVCTQAQASATTITYVSAYYCYVSHFDQVQCDRQTWQELSRETQERQ